MSSASSLSSPLCVSLFPKEVGPREDGRVICPWLHVTQTSSNKWETVDRNENIRRIPWRYTGILGTRLSQGITSRCQLTHWGCVSCLDCNRGQRGSTCTINRTLCSSEVSITNVAQRKGHSLGSYSSPLDPERGAVESQACWCLPPPCGGSFLLLLRLPL